MATILVVDDDPAARDLIVTVLGYAGHAVREAEDGAEALVQARELLPDLIIADLLMPTMDGFEFVRQLREEPQFSATPVMFYTATYLESEVKALIDACGAVGVISKPAEPEEILSRVATVLGAPPKTVGPVPLVDFHREHLGILTAKLSRMAAEATPRLEAMIELSLKLASERDPRQLLDNFCTSARKIIGAKYAAVGVLDPHDKHIRYQFVSGMNAEFSSRITSPALAVPVQAEWMTEPTTHRFTSLSGDPESVGLPRVHPPVHSFLRTAIVSPDRVYGWLCLADKIGAIEFNDEDEGLARILAAQVGRIYENGSLYAELSHRAEALEREIVERKRIEDALRRSEAHLQQLVDSALDVIFTFTPEGIVTSLNPAFEVSTGHRRDRWIGRPFEELVYEDDIALARRMLLHVVKESQPQEFELRLNAAQGSPRIIDLRVCIVNGEAGPAEVLGIGRDISVRRLLEEEVRQAQKMESIGHLAGGVAHDFNNILTVIEGHASFIRAAPALPQEMRESADEIVASAERASQLTRQLLAFGRRQVIQVRELDLNMVIAGLNRMLQRILGEDMELRFEPHCERAPVLADSGMMEQVLLNLVVNARDAMAQGGVVTITTSIIPAAQVMRPPHVDSGPESYVRLSVRDNGSGIDPKTLPRIFEPFFTTKPVGRGTGLGLATVYGIVNQHNGWITAQSKLGQGSLFHIHFPESRHQARIAPVIVTGAELLGGKETIMLVEDEESVRRIARNILKKKGYQVIEASTGAEALRIWTEKQDSIDLVITDVIMPGGMTGRQLAEELWKRHPGLKIILASGYHADTAGAGFHAEEGVNFLQKPYDMVALLRTIRAQLDAR